MSAKFCKNCGNELPLSYTVNYCPNCGHLIKKENRIAKYTSDGKPVIQGQENISTKATDPISKVSNVGAPTKNATPLNSSSHVGKTGSGHRNATVGIIILAIIILAAAYVSYVKGEELMIS